MNRFAPLTEHQSDPRYAAARLWVDAIIDPAPYA